MKVQSIVKKNAYYDSVTLMLISRELKKMDGVEEVLVGMGTDMNLDLTRNLGMFTEDLETISSEEIKKLCGGAVVSTRLKLVLSNKLIIALKL